MQMTPDEIYSKRKQFFNDHAEGWIDNWYRNSETGRLDRHARDFERLFSLLPLKAGDHILDAGCGSGVLVPYFMECITETGLLYELDFAERMIEVNRSLHQRDNIRFIVADAEDPPLDEACCHMVVCFSCFPHFHDKEKAVTALSRVLKPGGVFVVSHFDSSDGINRHHERCHAVMHDHLPDEAGMRALFRQANLSIEKYTDEAGFYCIIAGK